jgi:hypothetical protein
LRRLRCEKVKCIADTQITQITGRETRRVFLALRNARKILRHVVMVHTIGNFYELTGWCDPAG